jgi:hypothetical protein
MKYLMTVTAGRREEIESFKRLFEINIDPFTSFEDSGGIHTR